MKIGIIGTGKIAHKMARTIHAMGQELYGIASRDQEKANAFASEMEVTKAYGSYKALAEDSHIDLVYIATVHSEHYQNIKLCLDNGQNVLCEKAFTVNARQAKEVCALSEKKGLLLSEAIWTRYLPMRKTLEEILQSGIIGQIRMLTANLGYEVSTVKRIIEPSLAGGALLDVGVYPLNFALMVLGNDYKSLETHAVMTPSGVDEQSVTTFFYPDGKMATIESSSSVATDRRGLIYGTKGYIEVQNLNNPEVIRIFDTSSVLVNSIVAPKQLTGFEYEVQACLDAIGQGKYECEAMPHDQTILVMSIMDELRSRWGLRYPFE